NMGLDEAILLSIYCLSKVIEGKIEPQKIRIAIVPAVEKKFKMLTWSEIEKYLGKLEDFKNKIEKQ
ncbi:MAG: hypothetical protein N3E48_04160, partial [Candidatus Bathyarchaeota archaeon]|nr:hypothetical protein [Candidatus Bathyarchaeota archaeon]